jgi:GH24 family phage-related lysozyme (muramidase)
LNAIVPDFSAKALTLILDFEGLNQPGKWPGGASGVTIGIGYDLGYVTVDQFESDWGERLQPEVRGRLKDTICLRAVRAKNRAPELDDIRIRRIPSEEVFRERTIPLYTVRAQQAFPGFDDLPLDVQGALVSLVYNRGASMVDDSPEDRRREMRAVRDAVEEEDLQEIADQLRAMKRLWVGKNLDGLLRRRDAEAELVESAIG